MTSALAHNGGRSQVNVSLLQIGYEYPFLNVLKTAGGGWGKHDNTGAPDPSTLDSNGYPTSLAGGIAITTICYIPPQSDRSGNYVVGWTGNGTVDLSLTTQTPAAGFSSADLTSTTGSGRYKFLPGATSIDIGISAIGSPHISDMYVCHESDETAYLAGAVFGVQFKQRLTDANFGVIRFLNWQDGNYSLTTNWASRKPTTYVFYDGYEARASLYAGTTTNSGNAYSVAAPSGWAGLVDKATVIIRFNANATQSGTCSLNVGSTGTINILDRFSNALSVNANSYPLGSSTTNLACLMYDATLNAWIKRGGDVSDNSMGLPSGVPPELMVQLCAEVGAHPYFVTPVYAADPFTDYMPSLATYCKNNGPSWMIPRFEGPNETWNSGFPSTNYGNNKATAYSWGADYINWYGKVLSVLGQACATVYGIGNLGKTYHVICGIQTVTAGSSGNDARLTSAKYIGTTPQSPYSATAGVAEAYRWTSHGCLSNYIVPAAWNMPAEAAYVTGFANGDTTAAYAFADTVLGSGNTFANESLSDLAGFYAAFKTWLQSFGVQRMSGYEGGYSPDFISANFSDPRPTLNTDLMRLASKGSPVLGSYLIANYTNFTKQSDATFTAEFPSCFQLSGGIITGSAAGHTGGAWSVLDPSVWVTPDPAQWVAIKAWNSPKRAINLRMRIHG